MERKEMRDIMQEAIDKFQANCSEHMRHNAALNAELKTKVSRLCNDMAGVNTFLLKGNGKSLSERVVMVESAVGNIKDTIKGIKEAIEDRLAVIEQKVDEHRSAAETTIRARLTFWGIVLTAFLSSATALIVALINTGAS